LFCLSIRPTNDFVQELLSYGDSIELVSPKSLRDSLREKISQMYKIYNTDN